MKPTLFALLALIIACQAADEVRTNAPNDGETLGVSGSSESSELSLTPVIEPTGLENLPANATVTDLTIFGAIHLVPIDETSSASRAAFRFDLNDGQSSTQTIGNPLVVQQPGRYSVLLSIHPIEGQPSVGLSGSQIELGRTDDAQGLCEEAGPITADTEMSEAGPITADDEDMEAGPITADDEDMEAGPITADDEDMEAGPITADDEDMEAGPITADGENMEAGPITADNFDNRDNSDMLNDRSDVCRWRSQFDQSGRFETESLLSYEYDLGQVQIEAEDTQLLLAWDMTDWLLLVLGEDLGLSLVEVIELRSLFQEEDAEERFTPDKIVIETR